MKQEQLIARVSKKEKIANTISNKVLTGEIIAKYYPGHPRFKDFQKYGVLLNENNVLVWTKVKVEKSKYVVVLYQPVDQRKKVMTFYRKIN